MNGMEPDDLLCSRNARSQKALARANGTSRRASGWAWVRKLRAVEDQSAPIPEERTSELGGIIGRAGGRNSLSTLDSQDSCWPQVLSHMPVGIVRRRGTMERVDK
jgi:hypothetical protein